MTWVTDCRLKPVVNFLIQIEMAAFHWSSSGVLKGLDVKFCCLHMVRLEWELCDGASGVIF